MDRLHGSLEFQEPFEQTTGLMSQSLITVERNCHFLRDHVEEQRRSITDSMRAIENDARKTEAFQAALNFYDHIRSELVKLEEVCHEYRVKIKADMVSEMDQRLQPPFHTCFAAVKRAYDGLCNDKLLNLGNNDRRPKESLCNWTNVLPLSLDHTQDIIYGPKRLMPSEFDDTDRKFKQEMMILRTKMFSMSHKRNYEPRDKEGITDERRLSIGTATKKEFIETVRKTDSYVLPLLNVELSKVDNLKFVDGEFNTSDAWMRLLDTYGQQLRSKWYLMICPQIEALLKKHRITMIHLSPTGTFDFIIKIPENGLSCKLSRKDLIPLVERASELRWLVNSKIQLRSINGKEVAAILIQTCWRGFWVRKCMFETKCKYIAASIIWVGWIVLKMKRRMHERYLRNMLMSLDITRQLSLKLSNDYSSIINRDHVVIHLPSVGLPLDLRRTLGTSEFAIYQNTMGLKLSFVKNPNAHVIYVLPVKASDDLITMYHDLIESVLPNENAQRRLTFLELSQANTFANCSFNVSRTLHASENTLVEMKNILFKGNKPAFCLPWIMDECDVGIAGNFGLPLLAPDVEMQRNVLNKSLMSIEIDKLGLKQPPCVNDIKDYTTLCVKLAEQICANTEICVWLFKLNVGLTSMHTGVFLINHMSVPFMPILRKERDIHGDEWNVNVDIRTRFLKSLRDHLPGIVSTVTQLPKCYASWKEFYALMNKYGCLLQAVPNEKSSKYISVTLFVPGNGTGESTQWTGTVEKIYSARESRFSNIAYAMPQNFVNNSDLEPTIDRLTDALRRDGYFGHLCIDLYCFRSKQDDKIVTLVVETIPCYEHAQHFVDWIKLAINGSYDRSLNTFVPDVGSTPNIRATQRSSTLGPYARADSNWSETTGRCTIVIGNLCHSRLSSYSWKTLEALSKECGIRWNSSTKEGSHLILHDGTAKNSAMLISITSSIRSAMILTKNCLKKLYKALRGETRITSIDNNNLLEAIHCIDESLGNLRYLSIDKCDPLNRVR